MVRDDIWTVINLTTTDQYVNVPSGTQVGDVIEGYGPNGWQGVLPAGETFSNGATYSGGRMRKIDSSTWAPGV
jgi:hypothetical protein